METQNVSNPSATLASKLRQAAQTDKALVAVCTVWALRERARSQVTVNTLYTSLHSNGFTNYSKDDCANVLTKLADMGVGKIYKARNGRVKSLIDIKHTLQSIGLVVTGNKLAVSSFKPATRFKKLATGHVEPVVEAKPAASAPKLDAPAKETVFEIQAKAEDGRLISIPLTKDEFRRFLDAIIKP